MNPSMGLLKRRNKEGLLIIAPRLDRKDPLLAFLYYWIKELCRRNKKCIVIALKGSFEDAKTINAKVYLLNYVSRYFKLIEIIKIMIREYPNYNKVITLMYAPLMIIGNFFGILLNKKRAIYYTHGHVGLILRIVVLTSNIAITTSKEGLQIKTPKRKIISHGINTELFKPLKLKRRKEILYVGRISRIKRIDVILRLLRKHPEWKLRIIGNIMDIDYYKELKEYINKNNLKVVFEGPVEYEKLPYYYNSAKVFIHPSLTHSLDKVVLEAWACELPVLTSNIAYRNLLAKHGLDNKYYFKDEEELEEKFNKMIKKNFKFEKEVFKKIVNEHSYKKFIEKVNELLEEM